MSHLRPTRIPLLAALACLAVATLAVAESGSAATSLQHAAKNCTPPSYPGSGYFTGKIRVTNVSCAYGKRFVVAYYNCRTRKGATPAGRCRTRVLNFKCTENPRNVIATEIDARVICNRGTQRIVHTYQQNLE